MAATGLVLLVVGVVMLTLAAPPQQVGGDTAADGLLVTDRGVLALTGERVQVDVDGDAFVGVGRAGEVQSWADGLAATTVAGVADPTTLAVSDVDGSRPGEADPVADPLLADIWQQEQTGETTDLGLSDPGTEDVLVVVAADGADVRLTWDRSVRHPGAWPLVVAGVVDLGLGVAWLVVLNARTARRLRRA